MTTEQTHIEARARVDLEYQDLLVMCIQFGEKITARNSPVSRRTVEYVEFGSTPLISVRKTAWKNALREWEWFMSGSNQIQDLHESVRSWWQPWALNKSGTIYGNYGQQFRGWRVPGDDAIFDQIEYLITGIREHPYSRRNVITTWNTPDMANPSTPITNCHGTVIQAFVSPGIAADSSVTETLSLFTYQRSVDVICGLPHNWIQYWAFLLWLAHRTGKQPGKLQWMGGDVHVYQEHIPLAQRLISLDSGSLPSTPALVYTPTSEEFRSDDFVLEGQYTPVNTETAAMVV